jgi:hypothetical protein
MHFGLARIRPRSSRLSPPIRGWESTATCGSCWRRPERSGIAKGVVCTSGHCERSRRQSWQPPPSSGSYAAGGRGQMSSPLSLLCPPISPTHRPTRRLRSPLPASSSQRCPRASVQRGHADGGYEAVLGGPLPLRRARRDAPRRRSRKARPVTRPWSVPKRAAFPSSAAVVVCARYPGVNLL